MLHRQRRHDGRQAVVQAFQPRAHRKLLGIVVSSSRDASGLARSALESEPPPRELRLRAHSQRRAEEIALRRALTSAASSGV